MPCFSSSLIPRNAVIVWGLTQRELSPAESRLLPPPHRQAAGTEGVGQRCRAAVPSSCLAGRVRRVGTAPRQRDVELQRTGKSEDAGGMSAGQLPSQKEIWSD